MRDIIINLDIELMNYPIIYLIIKLYTLFILDLKNISI